MYYKWEFTLDDGSTVIAKFTDKEIEKMKKDHPEINWK